MDGHWSTSKIVNSDLPVHIYTISLQLHFQKYWSICIIQKLSNALQSCLPPFEMTYQLLLQCRQSPHINSHWSHCCPPPPLPFSPLRPCSTLQHYGQSTFAADESHSVGWKHLIFIYSFYTRNAPWQSVDISQVGVTPFSPFNNFFLSFHFYSFSFYINISLTYSLLLKEFILKIEHTFIKWFFTQGWPTFNYCYFFPWVWQLCILRRT